jgi:protein TonB
MDRRQRRLKNASLVGGTLLAVLVLGLVIRLIHSFMANKPQQPQRTVENITLLRPPPPPPPPPQTPPPPPPKIEQQPLEQKQADPTPDKTPAPPQPQLGLDAAGSAGGDAFGLLARQGGADLVGTGGAVFAWYTDRLRTAISDRLTDDPRLHSKKFKVDVRVWITADGHIRQVRVTGSSGSEVLDAEISAALDSLGQLEQAPPIEMPQPVTLQIVGRS